MLPVTFSYGGRVFPVGNALVDTGADFTLLPMEVAHLLKIPLDDAKAIRVGGAGGDVFVALPSQHKVGYAIAKKGHRTISWEGTIYFAEDEPTVLLGYRECLEYFDLTFEGPEKRLSVLPRM